MDWRQRVVVVPVPWAERTQDLLTDCSMITEVVRKLLEENSELTATAAYDQARSRLERICIFPWDLMVLVEEAE